MSITRLDSGKYQVRYRDGHRHKAKSFDRKSDANAFDARVRLEKQTRGMVTVEQGKTTLAVHTHRWWETHAKPNLTDGTRTQYKSLYNRLVQAQLGNIELRQLTPMVLIEWQAGLSRNTPAPTTSEPATSVTCSRSLVFQPSK